MVKFFIYVLLTLSLSLRFAYAANDWLDLPPDRLSDILYEYDSEFDYLNTLVQNYHAIPKNSWNTLTERRDALSQIEKYSQILSKKMTNEYLRRISKKYSNLANHKRSYLRDLKHLKDNYKTIRESIISYTNFPVQYIPLQLNNSRKLDFKTQEFWGEYFIEAIDPCHRRLMNSYHEVWKQKYPNKDLPDFFLWLEDKNVSLFFPSITLYNKDELQKLQVTMKQGKFFTQKNHLVTTVDIPTDAMFKNEPIFIVDGSERMYIAYSSNQHAHVSLSHYKPLIGSGKIWIDKGIITKISFESGHYLPQIPHFVQTLRFWEKNGIKINDNIELIYYEGYHEKKTTVGDFKRIYYTVSADLNT